MDNNVSFLTSAQQGVYIDCILDPENLQYNNPKSVLIPDGVLPEEVAAAVKKMLECHPALFSHFEERDGRGIQVYADRLAADVKVVKVNDDGIEAARQAFIRPFDIGQGPLFRAEVLSAPSRTELLLDFHHLVYDGASLNILMEEFCAALDGSSPSPETGSYKAFADAQQSDSACHKSYYDKLFADGVTSTQIPADLGGENGSHREYVLPVSAGDVMSRAKALGTAPSALFIAAAFYTAGRYANTKELCMTTISNGRLNPLSKGVVGMFVNTLPLVGRIEDVSVREFIHGIRGMFQEIREHEEYPFAALSNDYGLARHIHFSYQYGTLGNTYQVRGGQVKADPLRTNSHAAPFTIIIHNIDGKPAIVINYDSARYSADLAGRFAESMDSVVSRFLDEPEGRLLSVSIMSARQQEEVASCRQTCIDSSAVRFPLFHNSIEYWAEQTPDAVAVIASNETLSYRQLNAKANILAHSLIKKGVVPGDRVCLLLPRRSWHLISMFGVMKTGAAYIPCDPEYPAERIRLITEDSHARYVITTKDKLAEYGDRALDILELLAGDPDGENSSNPLIGQDGDSLAYLIYTSGSTGRPKGVMLRHRGICNYLTDHEENRHFHALVSGCRTMLCITTVSFDLSLKEIGSSLFNGMTLVFADETQVNDPSALAALMRETAVDGFSGTPSRLKMFLDLPAFRSALAKCRFIVLGGEKYPPTLLPQIKEIAPGARLFNTYGPTEISVSCNGKELTHSDIITIGRPLLNVKEYVVDEDLNELPIGVTGELLIGGLGVAAGYNDLPDKTAEAFIDYHGERCYKSGDYAYWNTEGEVVILGRKDNQIKLNGLRIELGEVETVLNRQPQIKEAVAMIKSVDGHDHLVAYYTVREKVSADTLKEQIGRSLTHYMVPTIFVELEKMPVSPNGKTDLKALPQPVLTLSDAEKVMPATSDEQNLYDIVSEITGSANFGVTTNLIGAGLTSLLAIRLSVYVKERMNAGLPVRDILRYPTVRELAGKLQKTESEAGNGIVVKSVPLSFSQIGIYSECAANPEDIQYNIPVCLTMPQGITALQLKAAVEKVLQAHPYLNVHFQSDDDGRTYQCPMDRETEGLPSVRMSEQELEQEKKSFVRPFALQEGPLYRFEIVESPSAVHLLADFHHLVMDGSSLDIFYKQLCQALDGKAPEKEKYDYYRFVADQKADASTEQFFARQLGVIEEASALLPDRYDADDSHRQGELSVPADLQAIQPKCKELGITPASLYLAAVMVTVSKYTAEDTVGICTISNGRSNLNLSGTFGMFVNTLPLVSRVDPLMAVDDYLHQVAGTFVDTLANEDYPFGSIVEKFGYAANIVYAYQVGVLNRYVCGCGEIGMQKLELQKAKFPVSVFIEGSLEKGGVIKLQYDESLFSEDMIRGFAASLRHVADELLVREKLGDVSICDDNMLELLDSFNLKDKAVPAGEDEAETVLSLFRRAAQEYPDNIAGVFKDKKYTYRELDALTDKIGSLIYDKVKDCTKAEPVVSMLIPRNEYMFILPLAAMKAGCAYQPLDPSYPSERLNFMVKDADAALLIVDPTLDGIINEYDGEVVLVSGLDNAVRGEMPADPLTPQSLFILLYTSGSTGVPKGVMLEHQNLVAFIRWYRRYYGLKPEHKVAAYASFGFDANMMDMYPALTTGATVYVIPEEMRLDLVALNGYFEAVGITHSFMTTQVGVQFMQNTENHSLKHLSVGGEKLVSVDPPAEYAFYNGYGPTECTIFTTTMPVLSKESNIPIGKPTDALDCYVMDKQLHRLPVGAAGELVIAGAQVGRGYLNRPDKTAEAFFTLDGRRAYHSGDIVRYRQDGNIEFVGRKDGQVKIRGFRIELKEVEAVIREFALIRDVTVQAFDSPDGGKFIAAYVVGDSTVDIKALNEFILDRKPPYMVPAVTMQIEKIPLNVNQKVDRKALPKPELKSGTAGDVPAAPLNALETELKAIIASVLNTEEFTITDILGTVGLTSISGIRLAALVFKKFGVQVNVKNLSVKASLQSIENEILQVWMSGGKAGTAPETSVTEAPLTFPQQGVYMDCQMNPDTTMYNIPTMLEFPADTDPDTLKSAVKKVSAAHPALLCNFFQSEGEVVMRPGSADRLDVPVRTIGADEINTVKQDFVRPFDLEHDTLFRAEICSVPDGPRYLLLDLHHLVADGASLDLVIRQILSVLEGGDIEKENRSYLEFAKEQNEKAVRGGTKESKSFFDGMFASYESAANVPADKTSTEAGLPQHAVMAIPEHLLKLTLPEGVTPAHFWFAAFNYALSRFANTKDVYTAFISSGRQNVRIADTVGMFV
ncbi:MAG: amino acid adenylation domain-containing protein, partial [Bacteroidales bacterium]|nr:amino acid adenylation domain-containing protein [Bacteroidales bacterium]